MSYLQSVIFAELLCAMLSTPYCSLLFFTKNDLKVTGLKHV